jgi:hypothetical protein
LSNFIPELNWYGIINYFFAFAFVFFIVFNILSDFNSISYSGIKSLFFIVVFYLVFIIEAVYMLTFSTLSILLFGTSFIFVCKNNNPKTSWAYRGAASDRALRDDARGGFAGMVPEPELAGTGADDSPC